jgi:hypothetical protein
MAAQNVHSLKPARKPGLKTSKEVRAGPGDAGRQDRPERLPERPGGRQKGRNAVMLFAVLCAIGAVIWLILQVAA